jgi:hypothetical protein
MSWVFPGLEDVLASFLFLQRELIKEDFPTFDLPIKAYSGRELFGHFSRSVLLITNWADLMFILSRTF